MLRLKKQFFFILIMFIYLLSVHNSTFAQQRISLSEVTESPHVQKLIHAGKVSPQQIQEGLNAVEKGQMSPEILKQYQKKAQQGSLTPAEIEAGKSLLELQKATSRQTTGDKSPPRSGRLSSWLALQQARPRPGHPRDSGKKRHFSS